MTQPTSPIDQPPREGSPPPDRSHSRFPCFPIALALTAITLGATTTALAQANSQLDNGFRNRLSAQGPPPDPALIAPFRTAFQWQNGTAFGGWQTTRLKDASGNVTAGSPEETPGPATLTYPSFTPTDGAGNPVPGKGTRLRSSKFGRPIVLQSISLPFGSVIARPARKADGTPLNPNILAQREYYLPKPANAGTGRFYWSPHAEKVFATESGSIVIDWQERTSGNIVSTTYSISAAPIQTPRKIFWNQAQSGFNAPPVTFPDGRVRDVHIAHSASFPETVPLNDAFDPTPSNGSEPELRTLWYDQAQRLMFAFNLEGRVFVEFLGNLKEPDRTSSEHLGFEIVDVVREERPVEIAVELGDPIPPTVPSQLQQGDENLTASVIAGLYEDPAFFYEHQKGDSTILYAIRETTPTDLDGPGPLPEQLSNEALVYWLEEGLMGILWPKYYSGYFLRWPGNIDRYSVYARPDDPALSSATGVQLNVQDNPEITFQDDPDEQQSTLTPEAVFITDLGSSNLSARSLIRYTRNDEIWFERVFSVPNTSFDTSFHLTANVADRINPTDFFSTIVELPVFAEPEDLEPSRTYNNIGEHPSFQSLPNQAHTKNASFHAVVDFDESAALEPDTRETIWETGAAVTGSSLTYSAGNTLALNVIYNSNSRVTASTQLTQAQIDAGELDLTWSLIFVGGESSNQFIAQISIDGQVVARSLDLDTRIASWSGNNGASFGIGQDSGQIGGFRNSQGGGLDFTSGTINAASGLEFYADSPRSERFQLITYPANGQFVGHIHQPVGTAFNPDAYIDPLTAGFEEAKKGAIIPVNATPQNDKLEIWWFASNQPPSDAFSATYWPTAVQRYQLQWPAAPAEIVLARNDGTSDLPVDQASGKIYRQSDPTLPGYNPNEEHALVAAGRAWALRDDLNLPNSSEPFVLLDYIDGNDGRPAMRAFSVLREKPPLHTFDYTATAGVILQAPMPLPILPLPIKTDGSVKNAEVIPPSPVDPPAFPSSLFPDLYDADKDLLKKRKTAYKSFTWIDRKGSTWVYRGPHAPGVNVGDVTDPSKNFSMHYYYKTQTGFDFPKADRTDNAPAPGTIVPYLRPPAVPNGLGSDNSIANDEPHEIVFHPVWPSTTPVLNVGETLALPKHGLPAVRGQTSAELIYQQSVAQDPAASLQSARLFDPTRAKTYKLDPSGLTKIPDSAVTSDYLGKLYFPALPPHLSQRFFYDPNIGTLGALVLVGEFADEAAGEDYFLLNVLSDRDLAALEDIPHSTDLEHGNWVSAVAGLTTTVETFTRNQLRRGVWDVVESAVPVGPQHLAEISDDDTAVDSYAVSASGGGTGYIVLAVGDGEAFTPVAEPVSLQVFKVDAPLYRGELKIVKSSNPLDEKLTLQHSGDFAAHPDDYEFAWLYSPPASDGLSPVLYHFNHQLVLGDSSWQILKNPTLGYQANRSFGADVTAWGTTGNLAAATININDGLGSPGNTGALPHAVLRREFAWNDPIPIDLFLSLELQQNDGAAVFLNGTQVAAWNYPDKQNSLTTSKPEVPDYDPLPLVFKIDPSNLLPGNNTITVDLYTLSDPDPEHLTVFNLRLEGTHGTANLSAWIELTPGAKSPLPTGTVGKNRHTIEGASLLTLSDNYLTMRYRARQGTAAAEATGGDAATPGNWSRWMPPQLAEGWIKRVLAGINPFRQRVTDLLNNSVNTDVSLITQAGPRWEGDIALNLANIDDFGLIEIYETVLKRGKSLSISGTPAIDYPPANDALLLAAGYLNDLYMILGNEAFADAANPTIAFSSDDRQQFGDIATSLFAFKGPLATVLDEELALLRGRDDFLQPRIEVSPFYNRLPWNFTRGIDSGEAIYALNYNITDLNADGVADATDAAIAFPQAHGDAYGHYLTALTGYYSLLSNPNFSWTPRIEAVTVLGQPVSVDYFDERKFAAAAVAVTRTASKTLDLTYRQQFAADESVGWEPLDDGRFNDRTNRSRHWGTDDWACRAGQGALVHWATANSMLPALDTAHEGIQKIDRTTVSELDEIASIAETVQDSLDNADARLNPLGLSRGALSFDISPTEIDQGRTHFEQVYDRAVTTLQNAVFAFDNAKGSAGFLRRQEDSLDGQRFAIDSQENAFDNGLIEIFGTPYTDDIGPGKTYVQGYDGPDLLHYYYVEIPELYWKPAIDTDSDDSSPAEKSQFKIGFLKDDLDFDPDNVIAENLDYWELTIDDAGHVVKPDSFTGRRAVPGRLQTAVSGWLRSRRLLESSTKDVDLALAEFLDKIRSASNQLEIRQQQERDQDSFLVIQQSLALTSNSLHGIAEALRFNSDRILRRADQFAWGKPIVAGMANDPSAGLRASTWKTVEQLWTKLRLAAGGVEGLGLVAQLSSAIAEYEYQIGRDRSQWKIERQQTLRGVTSKLVAIQGKFAAVDLALRDMDQAERELREIEARGRQLLLERETFRKRAAAIIQGYRTKDFAFRAFRDEALEKYQTLFDLAAQYTYLAARAYDYETGLLDTRGNSAATAFFDKIVQSRALGVVDENGHPQFSSSDNGDPGLAGVLAQMNGDWSVVRSRVGFNNPDRYRTTFSLRNEAFRKVNGPAGDLGWSDILTAATKTNILEDPDVRRYAMQAGDPSGLAVPGIVLEFQTSIQPGANFFGWSLAGGDHTFSPTSFATKIRSSGIAFEGYVGMDDPTSTSGALTGIGAGSPGDPLTAFDLDNALSATPYVYLIPAGVDRMRSPALGDTSTIRSWTVDDQAIPLPFNIGNSDFSTNPVFTSADSLTEPAFAIRKHQAFRAVPAGTVFQDDEGFTNSRLIGRSVWNSSWKLVIPGDTLHGDPGRGLEVFKSTVTDIKLHFESYSYSGN